MTDDRTSLLGQRASLRARMRNVAASVPGTNPARRVQLTRAIDRYLARLLATTQWGWWVLKGGHANQLRAPSEARFTQDVDLKLDAPLRVLVIGINHQPRFAGNACALIADSNDLTRLRSLGSR